MAKITLDQLKESIKSFPIAYYAGHAITIDASDEVDCSMANPGTEKVIISLDQINASLSKAAVASNSMIRPNVYHEVAHVMNTPRCLMTICDSSMRKIMNVFEDERNERCFKHAFMNVDFYSNVLRTNNYDKPELPLFFFNFFYIVVRFHDGGKFGLRWHPLLDATNAAIAKWAFLDCCSGTDLAYQYLQGIRTLCSQFRSEYDRWSDEFVKNVKPDAASFIKLLLADGLSPAAIGNADCYDLLYKLYDAAGFLDLTQSDLSALRLHASGSGDASSDMHSKILDTVKRMKQSASDDEEAEKEAEDESKDECGDDADEESGDDANEERKEESADALDASSKDGQSASGASNAQSAQPDDSDDFDSKKAQADAESRDKMIVEKDSDDMKASFKKAFSSSISSKVMDVLAKKMNLHDVNGCKAAGRHGYSGKADPKSVGRKDWKIFFKKSDSSDGTKIGRNLHLIIVLDQSGSYRHDDEATNCVLNALLRTEKSVKSFTFDVVKFGDRSRIADKDDRQSHSYEGTKLDEELAKCIKKCHVPDALNYVLLLNDGSGYYCSQMNEALDSKDVAIICDQDAEHMYKYVHHAKKIVCTDYPAVLEDSVVQIFNEMLVA